MIVHRRAALFFSGMESMAASNRRHNDIKQAEANVDIPWATSCTASLVPAGRTRILLSQRESHGQINIGYLEAMERTLLTSLIRWPFMEPDVSTLHSISLSVISVLPGHQSTPTMFLKTTVRARSGSPYFLPVIIVVISLPVTLWNLKGCFFVGDNELLLYYSYIICCSCIICYVSCINVCVCVCVCVCLHDSGIQNDDIRYQRSRIDKLVLQVCNDPLLLLGMQAK